MSQVPQRLVERGIASRSQLSLACQHAQAQTLSVIDLLSSSGRCVVRRKARRGVAARTNVPSRLSSPSGRCRVRRLGEGEVTTAETWLSAC